MAAPSKHDGLEVYIYITLFCYTIIMYNVCRGSFRQEATYEIGTS